MSAISEALRLREVGLPNRLVLSPMCQYGATDGHVNAWHRHHLGRFAIGGFGGLFVEATAVVPEGRITNGCLGLWSEDHVPGLRAIAEFTSSVGAVPGIQLGHAGRKACMQRPWEGNGPIGQAEIDNGDTLWTVVGPTSVPFDEGWLEPEALDESGMAAVIDGFVEAAKRALRCGFRMLEIHAAHGYLLHSFLSPLGNARTDRYGGDLEGRCRFPLEVISAVREAWPAELPLFVRVSAVDGVDGGWSLDDTVEFAKILRRIGVDVVDCSSGGMRGPATAARLTRGPGFQLEFAEAVRREAGIRTMGVGLIRTPDQAEDALSRGQADLIAIGREALVDPNWALHALDRLALDDEPKFARWPNGIGWWLLQRERSIASSANACRTTRS